MTLRTHERAGHAFARPGATCHEQAATLAGARTLEYLEKYLAGRGGGPEIIKLRQGGHLPPSM